MTVRLRVEPWGRLPDFTRPLPPPRPERSSLAWAVPYWVAAVLFAYAVHADWLPVRSWLEALAASSRAKSAPLPALAQGAPSPTPPVDDQARRRSAMGVYLAEEDERDEWPGGEPASDWEPLAAETPDDDEAAATADESGGDDARADKRTTTDAVRRGDEPRRGRTRARRRPAARAAAETSPPSERGDRGLDGDERHALAAPARAEPATRSRAQALGAAVDEALARSPRRSPDTVAADDEPISAPSAGRRRSRGGKIQSCEAAIAAYNEEWTAGGGTGPRDLTAAQYGAVLNGGAYFRHCGVPASTGVRICAAVQNGEAVGVTVTTTPRSAEASACIAAAVRGLAFPRHPRLDVTTTVFKPVR